ncbi:MAG: hypothetical protein ACI82A_001194 [Candidatus Azotimanducaceae bacterium]|jgi:hypothetical protein
MKLINESHIKEIFADERVTLHIPRLDHVDWAVLDYFGWIHPGGQLGYVVAPLANDDDLRGMVLRRVVTNATRPRMEMCSWCNHVHKRNGTAMFSVVVKGTDERRTIGNRMCRNLDCSLRIRNLSSDPPSYMMETLNLQNKVMRLQNSIYRFLYRANALYTT